MELVKRDLYKSYYEKWIEENGVSVKDQKSNKSMQINDLSRLVRTHLILLKCGNVSNSLINVQSKEEPGFDLSGPFYELANRF